MEKTIKSVESQSCKDFEYIVVDGGSTDGSVEVIKQNEKCIDIWKSEKDEGIYNAMNNGVSLSSGEYCLLLNSGDYFFNSVVMKNILASEFRADIVTGDSTYDDGRYWKAPIQISLNFFLDDTLSHQASFIHTSFLKKYPYDETKKIVSDWKFFFDCCVFKGATYQPINIVVATQEAGGISASQAKLRGNERKIVIEELVQPEILIDYKKWRGKTDLYYRLFTDMERSPYKWKLYNFNVFVIKMLNLNKGWTGKLQFHK